MKKKFSSIWRVAIALVLIFSLGAVFSTPTPVVASPYVQEFQTAGNGTAEWSYEQVYVGGYSFKLTIPQTYTMNDAARSAFIYTAGDLNSITSFSYYYYVGADTPQTASVYDGFIKGNATVEPSGGGYAAAYGGPYLIFELDADGNGTADTWVIQAQWAATTSESWQLDNIVMGTSPFHVATTLGASPFPLGTDWGSLNEVKAATIGVHNLGTATVLKFKIAIGEWNPAGPTAPDGPVVVYVDAILVDGVSCQDPEGMVVRTIECPEGIITPCTNFGVKACIVNGTGDIAHNVTASIDIHGPASLLPEMPVTWDLGTMNFPQIDEVGWTLHCDGPGDVSIRVYTNIGGGDWCYVEQEEPAQLLVTVDSPCEICTNCSPDNQFTVTADIENVGDVDAHLVQASLAMSGPGTAIITSPTVVTVGTIPAGTTNSTASWTVTCTGDGDITFTVTASGSDVGLATGLSITHQRDVIVVVTNVEGLPDCGDPDSPTDIVSTQQKFEVTAEVTNCSNIQMPMDITLTLPPGTMLSTEQVHIEHEVGGHFYIDPVETVHVDPVCGCCWVRITWTLVCTESSDGVKLPIVVTAESIGQWLDDNIDCQEAWVIQEDKVHLTPTLTAYVFDCDGATEVNAVAVSQDFDVKITMTNSGEADAETVMLYLDVVGDTDCVTDNLAIDFGTVAGDQTKVKWLSNYLHLCHCLNEGQVTVSVDSVERITGDDENTCDPILEENIDWVCFLILDQVPFTVEIIQPSDCDDIDTCTNFTVKATLTNESLTRDIYDVDVTLTWSDSHRASLAPGQAQTINIPVIGHAADAETPTVHEVTWQMRCEMPGDVTFHVCAESTDPHLQVSDINDPAVTIHQIGPPLADVTVEILSPALQGTLVATSQDFAVTAVITNNEPYATVTIDDAEVIIDPWLSPEWEQRARVTKGPTPALDWVIPAGESVTATWTLHCEKSGHTIISVVVWGGDEVCKHAYAYSDPVFVIQYPAAHLEVQNIHVTESTVTVSENFTVTADIVNTGEADAWEVSATLSVTPDGSARVVAGDYGYTQFIGTIPGHGSENNSIPVEWTLHCKEACESTITITAEGFDEYGWHKKQECQSTGTFLIEPWEEYGGGVCKWAWCDSYSGYEAFFFEFQGVPTGLIGPFNLEAEIAFNAGDMICCSGRMSAMGIITADGQMLGVGLAKDMSPCQYPDAPPHEPPPCVFDGYIDVYGGLFNIVNGSFEGTFVGDFYGGPDGGMPILVALTNGTYCSTMASTPGEPIFDRFIEDASVTVKQVEPSALANLEVTKLVNGQESITSAVGDDVTFTITVTNTGPADATSVWIWDLLPAGVNISSWDATQGFYYVMSGFWIVGDLANGLSATLTIEATVNTAGDIVNMATVDYCDQHDPVTGNNADVVTITVPTPAPPEPVTTVALFEGLNLISLPLIPEDPDIDNMLTGLPVTSVAYWTGGPDGEWWYYFPADPMGSDPEFTELNDGRGYWMFMTADGTLVFDGYILAAPFPALPPSYDVVEEWNLIGFKSTVPKLPEDYLAGIAGQYVMIYGFANEAYFIVGSPGFEFFQPGLGYWLALKIGESGTYFP